jgi:tRNA-splicing ligase RtcB (3'-phosphate/5'-hydroxy nucleic acid ligase)
VPASVVQSANAPIKLWAPLVEVESSALEQLKRTAALPWVFHHVAAMPDVHFGKGATVGSVVAMRGALSPAAVGVDIGCGMGAIRTSVRAGELPASLDRLRGAIEAAIPVGFNAHDQPAFKRDMPEPIKREGARLFSEFGDLTSKVKDRLGTAQRQVGTLGGGNHFIEVCLGSDDRIWLMLHSGSRNIGKELAEVHIAIAKRLAHNAELPDHDLAVFLAGTPEMDAYRRDLFWAQRYAFLNRRVMFELLGDQFTRFVEPHVGRAVAYDAPILCHHNYVAEEMHFGEEVIVTRKGAIRAGAGELGIIPGSMGTQSYIVRGLGNADSFESASHGAGRRMSRSAAKRAYTVKDLAEQTAGVCCRKDAGVLDEIPAAYKPINQVMKHQSDLVEIVVELKQVLCVKG